MDNINKCYICQKEINTEDISVSSSWFGQYQSHNLVRIICSECIKDDKNKEKYKNDK